MRRVRACFAIAVVILLLTLTTVGTKTNSVEDANVVALLCAVCVLRGDDKSGIHMPGLQKDEFALKQDGKSHPIAVFEEVKTNAARLHRSEGQNGTFSNFESGSGDNHRLNIIVLDFVNTPFPDQANARNELLKFLSEVAYQRRPEFAS
jgi:hypothetical protein